MTSGRTPRPSTYRSGVDCTGVLVAPDVVLTAGHCIGGIQTVKLDAADYRDKGEEIEVVDTIEHTNSWNTFDAAVLILAEEARTEPRIIATDCLLEDHYADGASVTMTGWGAKDQNGVQYDTLLRAGTTQVVDHDCSDINKGCNSQVSPGGELRAGGNGADACFGDSGGPLYLHTPSGDFLIGLTSRGYTQSTVNCGEGTIYVRADAILDWVENVSGRTLPRFDCDEDTGPGGSNKAPDPSADPITVVQGNTANTQVLPQDPNSGDGHSFTISVAPARGSAVVSSEGIAAYTAPDSHEGEDPFEITVTDDGNPPESASIEVQVTVVARSGGTDCGCASGPRGSQGVFAIAFGLILGLGRRRSSRPIQP